MAKYNKDNIGGKVVRDTETYIVNDNTELNDLVLSSTLLYPGKSTSGHKHDGQEEVYFFIRGDGMMEIDNEVFPVKPGDVVTIPDGAFHKVYNSDKSLDMYFICVFNGRRTV